MSKVRRLFVEKKEGYDVAAQGALADFRENLFLDGLQGVRIVLRYDIEGIAEEDYESAIENVFSEPAVDRVYREELPIGPGEIAFGMEYLPGQYDQRADSAAQCVQLLLRKQRPEIATATIYLLSGELTAEDVQKIKKYVINPVDSREASLEKPETLALQLTIPTKVETVEGFISMDDAQTAAYCQENGFAMSAADLIFTRDYFKKIGRNPTITELKVVDTYWSDHCRHTTFQTKLTDVQFEEGPVGAKIQEVYETYLEARKEVYGDRDKPVCLMDMATIYPKLAKKRGGMQGLDESEEINACSIEHKLRTDKGDRDYLVMFKNETHNHPTEIEPFGGAATCLGGAIRDPLSGRSYVYHAMRVTGSGDPRESTADTMEYKLPQRKITREAAAGYSSYGNQIGLATGLVNEVYHPGYKAKRMEIGAVVAAAPKENVRRERPEEGDVIVLIGGRTGRDGIGGATGSSKAHDEKSTAECGAEVQKGNPLTERKLQRLFRNPDFTRLVKRCNDFGAGGVCVAIGELADSLDIDLDKVPKKYEGLDGTEIAISESQERMAVVVAAGDVEKVLAEADKENLEATVVAVVTDSGRMRMLWNGQTIVDIEREFLNTNGATQYASALVANSETKGMFDEPAAAQAEDFEQTLLALLSDLNICSQKGLLERFDSTIGANTVLMPLGGKKQLTPIQTMVAKIPVLDGMSRDATMLSFGLDPYLLSQSPFHGAVFAILSSVAKLVAAGGEYQNAWLTLQEYFERMGAPEKWGKPVSALLGAMYAQQGLGIAAIGGKDSMSGTFRDISVPPTLCSFALTVAGMEHIISTEFKKPGNHVYLLDIDLDPVCLPVFEDVKEKYSAFSALVKEGKIAAAYAVERGGMLAALAKMAMGNGIGVRIDDQVRMAQLCRKLYGAILFESAEELPGYQKIADLTAEGVISYQGSSVCLEKCEEAFRSPLEKVFPSKTAQGGLAAEVPLCMQRAAKKAKLSVAKPHVVIPVFPGTNCEYDSKDFFQRAGATAETVIIRNLTPQAVEDSIARLVREIENSQIIMLPGGFSGGDEPDGSGKFITAVFRNPLVSEAVMNLLKKRDGLMLGICNGFQALIKLGLVPYGEIRPMGEDSPTLTFNTIGRHASCLVHTRVASVKSPWLANVNAGDVHTIAISHGEGRFTCTPQELQALAANGQIATQYCDEAGNVGMDISVNPNGAYCAVEGLLSPDGRVFGKMGHSERYTDGLLRNVPGEKDQGLARAGVEYFL